MATATNTTEGEIVLGGDLTGSADAPELVSTGVIPGTYVPIQTMHADAKGRVVSIGRMPGSTLAGYVAEASHIARGVTRIGNNIQVSNAIISVNTATSSVLGAYKLQSPIAMTAGEAYLDYNAMNATTSTKGVVQIGAGVDVSAGTISVTIPDATTSTKGKVQIGSRLAVSSGTVSLDAPDATDTLKGILSAPAPFQMTDGVISLDNGFYTNLGVVQIGTGFNLSGDTISLGYGAATAGSVGVVQIGASLENLVGMLELANASLVRKGIMRVGPGLNVTAGVISTDGTLDATTSSKGSIQVGTGLSVTAGVLARTTLADATGADKGVVQVAPNGGISVTSGVLSSKLATTSEKGIMQPGAGVSISGNVISANIIATDATTSSKGVAQFNPSHFTVIGAVANLSPAQSTVIAGTVLPVDTSSLTFLAAGDLDVGTNIVKLDTFNTYTGAQAVALVTSGFAPTFAPNFANSNTFAMTLTGNATLLDPINTVPGGVYTVIFTQDGTGSRTMTLAGSAYRTNKPATLTTTPGKSDMVTFICKSASEIFVLVTPGF